MAKIHILLGIVVLPLFVEASSDKFQIDSEFRCTQDKDRVMILITLQRRVPDEVIYIRIKNKAGVDLSAYTPPSDVQYPPNASNTAMIPWKNGWFIALETNNTESVNVVVDNNLTLWNKTIPVNCDKPTCSSSTNLSLPLWSFVMLLLWPLFCLIW